MASRFKIEAEVGANITPLERAFAKAQGAGSKLAQGLKGQLAGAFSAAAVMTFARHVTSTATAIKEMAAQMQVSNKEAQQIQYEAELTGNQFTDIRMNLNRLGQAREKAMQGDEAQIKTFRQLGISLDDIRDKRKKDLEILRQIGRELEGATPGEVFAFKGLFGVEAFKTLEAVKALGKERDIPLMSDESINIIDEANQKWGVMWKGSTSLFADTFSAMYSNVTNAVQSLLSFRPVDAFNDLLGWNKFLRDLEYYRSGGEKEVAGKVGGKLTGLFSGGFSDVFTQAKIARENRDKNISESETQLSEAMSALQKIQAELEFKKLDAAGKRLAIEQKIKDLQTQAASISDSPDRAEQNRRDSERARLLALKAAAQIELLGLPKNNSSPLSSFNATPSVDALGRIGGSAGSATQTTNNQLKEISTGIAALNRQVRDGINLKGEL